LELLSFSRLEEGAIPSEEHTAAGLWLWLCCNRAKHTASINYTEKRHVWLAVLNSSAYGNLYDIT
jgi:hypothetical protein